MSLFTLEELAVALGRDIETEEEPVFQFLIDSISDYIETYCGMAFSLHEDETVRYRADGHGIVELIGPVIEVHEITTINGLAIDPPAYDDFDEIFYLEPRSVVDVRYDYGMEEVPGDIKGVAIEAVKGVITGPDSSELDTYSVGDVIEKYRKTFGITTFDTLQTIILDSYRGIGISWRMG